MKGRSLLLPCVSMVLVFACFAAAADQVYRWVDKDGKVHYSGTPPATTDIHPEKIGVPAPQVVSMPATAPVQPPPRSARQHATPTAADKEKAYQADVQIRGQECADLQLQLDAVSSDISLSATERAAKVHAIVEQMNDPCR